MTEPSWSQIIRHVWSIEREAGRLLKVAMELRCPALDSGGAQCTRDKHEGDDHSAQTYGPLKEVPDDRV